MYADDTALQAAMTAALQHSLPPLPRKNLPSPLPKP